MSQDGKRITWLGLGVMGYPMAGHLARAGHTVTVYNRTASKAEQWVTEYADCDGALSNLPAQAVAEADIVFTCVGADPDLRELALGRSEGGDRREGFLMSMKRSAVWVDHTTASADIAREFYELCAERGVGFIDAPVSGGQAGAENGQLTVMCGGDAEVLASVQPAIDCFAKSVKLLGDSGSGQLCKMVNQICIGGLVEALSEALHFAKLSGLNPSEVIEVISKGAAQSWQMENRYQTMLEGRYDFGFAVDWMRKDFALVFEEAQKHGVDLPVTKIVDRFYADVQEMGGGRWDTSSLFARLEARDAPDEVG